MSVHVTAAPIAFQPDRARIELTLPAGITIAEMVAMALPGASEPVLERTRVALVKGGGMQIVPRAVWHRARPHAGVHVVIRVIPAGSGSLNSILMILVSVAAIAVAGFFAPAIAGSLGITSQFGIGAVKGVLQLGLTALGGLLVNALLPPPGPGKEEKPAYAITGWQNQFTPDAPVPVPFGTHRYAPPFAAVSYIEVVGDVLYTRAVFLHGLGPLEISQEKLGDTLLTKFKDYEIETRYGYPDDQPISLYTNQVIEERIGTDMVREFPRDATGEILDNQPTEPKPISRFTARDSAWAIAIFSFPAGLIKVKNKGGTQAWSVTFKRRYRLAGVEAWTDLPDITIRAKKQVGFFRQDRIDFPVRGAYEIEYERTSPSDPENGDQYALTCVWVVLQSWRPEYPFNFRKPVALTALRIKATHQLNGTLDTFNTLDKRIAPDWDAGSQAWIARATKNPASAALFALRGPGLYRARPDDDIDFPAFQDWHEFCTAKGLAYNRIHDFESTLGEALAAIGAAGRAAVRWNGRKWTVVIDRPRDLVVDHINPRNSSDFRWSPSYFEPPHALRVPFIDETNDYQQAERLVPWPGHIGPIDITEELKLPGKTNPDEIWREARRRQYEIMNRAVGYSAVQQGTARTATTGDLVVASRDVLKRAMHSARVKAVRGDHVETDGIFIMEAGENYAIRFRQFDADDTVGVSVVRTIATVPGESAAVRLTGSGEKPKGGDLIHFGPAVLDSIPLIISGITRGKNNSTVLAMLPAAPIIDELTDAEEPPAWSGRVGAEIDLSLIKPAVPVFTGIDSGTVETGDANGLVVMLADGQSGAIVVVAFKLQHRLAGTLVWQPPLTCTPAEGSIDVTGYSFDDEVELQAWAVSVAGVESDLTDIVTITIGSDDFVPPAPANSTLLLVL
ncbi:MAG: phage tail protein [Mesorhizobium sp.]|uniref:TipJ family phage tail tip protein n=1 Tax=Mesorhizobium sp. TaxID=1871066 RepID=UPI000FE80AA4|nr:phage tail protein [Mesorhizobium sp.]RWO97224.1 MAG: phage tail protein [Mesorhizobium sp.]TIM52559.1 MAG: phage tail protein [Mesorhizobium sp.]